MKSRSKLTGQGTWKWRGREKGAAAISDQKKGATGAGIVGVDEGKGSRSRGCRIWEGGRGERRNWEGRGSGTARTVLIYSAAPAGGDDDTAYRATIPKGVKLTTTGNSQVLALQLKLSARIFQCEFIWALLSFAVLCWFLPATKLDYLPAQCNIGGAFVLALSLVCLVVCLDNDFVAFWVPLALCIAAALAFSWLERHATVSLVPWGRLQNRAMMYVIGIAPITAFIDMSVSEIPTGPNNPV